MKFEKMSKIYSKLVDNTLTRTSKINDFSVGSVSRSLYEAISIELEQFFILTQENMMEAIDRGVYESFGFEREKAERSSGVVKIHFHSELQNNVTISRGSQFLSSDSKYPQRYETLEDYTAPKGALEVDVRVYCKVPGSVGNVPPKVINTMSTPVTNVDYVENPKAFQTGKDAEPLEELRSRFQSFIESLSKATVPALEYGTREVQGVSGVYIDEHTGLVDIYAHNENGNLPDSLKEKIKSNIENYRPAGVKVRVKPVERKDVDLDIEVMITNRDAVTSKFKNEIKNKVTRYLNSMKTSQDLVFSDLSRVIMNIDKQLIYDVTFSELDDNVNLKGSELIRAGEINVKLKYKK